MPLHFNCSSVASGTIGEELLTQACRLRMHRAGMPQPNIGAPPESRYWATAQPTFAVAPQPNLSKAVSGVGGRPSEPDGQNALEGVVLRIFSKLAGVTHTECRAAADGDVEPPFHQS